MHAPVSAMRRSMRRDVVGPRARAKIEPVVAIILYATRACGESARIPPTNYRRRRGTIPNQSPEACRCRRWRVYCSATAQVAFKQAKKSAIRLCGVSSTLSERGHHHIDGHGKGRAAPQRHGNHSNAAGFGTCRMHVGLNLNTSTACLRRAQSSVISPMYTGNRAERVALNPLSQTTFLCRPHSDYME
jgi:hypothetical protein